jgi:uncharacterized protein (TIGR02246 family)
MCLSTSAVWLCLGCVCQAHAADETAPQQAVRRFYDAFNAHQFDRVPDFTTADWNHINPGGGRTVGRQAVLKELHEVHSTFLKGITDTIENMDSRLPAPGVAIVTVKSRMSTFTMPDGVAHANEAHIRTFILVKHKSRWLITQDQNTTVAE